MQGAGLPIDASLRLLLNQAGDNDIARVISQVYRRVQAGETLSQALSVHGDVFDSLYLSLVRAGESSGALDKVLERLAQHRERAAEFRASLISIITYPAILVVVASISLFVMMSFVVPRFIPLFSEADQALPLLTKAVFGASSFFANTWWLVLAALIAGWLLFGRWRAVPANRSRLASSYLTMPLVGSLITQTDTVRLARTLAMLLRNGVPLFGALKLSKGAVANEAIREMVVRCAERVHGGARFSAALREEAILPALALDFVTIGEESGTLPAMLDRVADAFQDRVDRRLKRLLTLLEPALILSLGAVIGIVIVALLLAMLSLNELVV